MSARPIASTIVVGIVVLAVLGGVFTYERVPEGHTGVVTEFGAVTGDTKVSGVHFISPLQSVNNIEFREREYTMSNDVGEGDKDQPDAVSVKSINGTQHDVDMTVRYSVEREGAPTFVVDWRNERQFEDRFLRPEIRGAVYAEGGAMTQDEIYTREGRDRFAQATRDRLVQQAPAYVTIEAVIVRDVSLPPELAQRYNDLEGAKIDAQTQREQVKVEEAKAEQRIVQAEAEAKEIEITGKALRDNPEVLQLRQIQAYDEGTVFVIPSTGTEVLVAPQSTSSSSSSSTNGTSIPTSPGGS